MLLSMRWWSWWLNSKELGANVGVGLEVEELAATEAAVSESIDDGNGAGDDTTTGDEEVVVAGGTRHFCSCFWCSCCSCFSCRFCLCCSCWR